MGLSAHDRVVEIGPGKGSLTAFLLVAGDISIVEIDPEMIDLLKARFGSMPKVKLFQSDILKFDFALLGPGPFKVVGNLPYNLTSPILRRLSEWNGWDNAYVMVQKEVADRLCAAPGDSDYGALTAGMSLTCETERVFELSENSFNPPPKVKSTVVKLKRRAQPLTDDIEGTQRVIQAAFQQRRKTVLNSLSHGLKMEKVHVEQVLGSLGIPVNERPERLPVDVFIRLNAAL